MPELFDPLSGALMESEGDQMRLWSLSRGVLELVARRMELIGGEGEGGDADGEGVESAGHRVVAVYPDSGVGAMLQNRWAGAPYRFASVDDRVNSGAAWLSAQETRQPKEQWDICVSGV